MTLQGVPFAMLAFALDNLRVFAYKLSGEDKVRHDPTETPLREAEGSPVKVTTTY